MLRGHHRGRTLGSGVDLWKYWDDKRAGLVDAEEMAEVQCGLARSPGHCMTMGTASTMTAAAEVLGVTLPGASSIRQSIPPPSDGGGKRLADRGDGLGRSDHRQDPDGGRLRRRDIHGAGSGGSTNALIHLTAMAGRVGVTLGLDDFDQAARRVPVLADIRPGGNFLMEDFYYAGGLPALLAELAKVPGALHPDRVTVTGRPLRDHISGTVHDPAVIRPASAPLAAEAGIAVLRGNLAPTARSSNTSPPTRPCSSTPGGRRVRRLPAADGDHRRPGPGHHPRVGAGTAQLRPRRRPRHAGVRHAADPKHLLEQGVRDMVRISDARMSGTSYGACVLHIAPESFVGGPLALVRSGDLITSTSPPAPCTCTSTTPNSRGAKPTGPRLSRATNAATGRSTAPTSPRPIRLRFRLPGPARPQSRA